MILGGAGFLGRHVGSVMAASGTEVWSVDRAALDPAENKWLHGQVVCNVWSPEDWADAVGEINLIIHLASSTVPATAQLDPVHDAESNLIGTLKVLEYVCRRSPETQFIFASSGGAVYGVPENVPIFETHVTKPIGSYGVTKLAIENHLHVMHLQHGLNYKILRLSNPYGEYQRPDGPQGVIAVFARNALLGLPVHIWGDGSVVRDFIYAADVADAFLCASQYHGEHRVFNVGKGSGCSINQIISTLESLTGRNILKAMHQGREFDPPVNVLSVDLARSELGWSPSTSIEAGMANTLHWLSGHLEKK